MRALRLRWHRVRVIARDNGPVSSAVPSPPRPGPPLLRRFDARPWTWRLLGAALLAASASVILRRYLVDHPDEIWQVDLEVYREGARSLVEGRPVYDWLTDAPQYLPFTYPPFGALVGTPLLLVPFGVAGWLWSLLQVVLLWVATGLAFRPLLERAGARAGLAQGAVAAVLMQLQPLQEGIRFGQVNSIIVTLCLADVARRRVGWWPRGSLAGLATAVKLTPAVFWIHWAVTRQWRVLAASVLTAASVTAVTGLFAPSATAAYWSDALLDPGRLGPNDGTSNQSIRGVLLRLGPSEGPLLTVTWVLLVAVVAVVGFRLSARLHRLGEPVAVVATVGLVAFLVSPVSWVHHLHWGIVVLGALVGDGRNLRRVALAALGTVVLYARIPHTGFNWTLSQDAWRAALGPFVEQAYCWWALVALAAMWWFLARDDDRAGRDGDLAAGSHRGPGAQVEPDVEPDVDRGRDAGQNGVGAPAAASRVRTASTAHTPAPTLRMRDSRSRRSRARPSSAATPDTTSSAVSDPANTETGSR